MNNRPESFSSSKCRGRIKIMTPQAFGSAGNYYKDKVKQKSQSILTSRTRGLIIFVQLHDFTPNFPVHIDARTFYYPKGGRRWRIFTFMKIVELGLLNASARILLPITFPACFICFFCLTNPPDGSKLHK